MIALKCKILLFYLIKYIQTIDNYTKKRKSYWLQYTSFKAMASTMNICQKLFLLLLRMMKKIIINVKIIKLLWMKILPKNRDLLHKTILFYLFIFFIFVLFYSVMSQCHDHVGCQFIQLVQTGNDVQTMLFTQPDLTRNLNYFMYCQKSIIYTKSFQKREISFIQYA